MKKINRKLPIPAFLRQKRVAKKPGQSPGTLQFTGKKKLEKVLIHLWEYDENNLSEYDLTDIDDSKQYLESPSNTWINIYGLHDVERLKEIWNFFQLHPLMQEDIVNIHQRAKIEEYPEQMFFVIRMISISEDPEELKSEQVSVVIGSNYVLTFQEDTFPIFEPVLHRLKSASPRLRKNGPDYLAYALIDTIVDHYFKVLEQFGEEIEVLENEVLENFENSIPEKIHRLRRKLIFFRKAVWPLRDSLNSLLREESKFINEENKVYFRDVHDHTIQIIDGLENYRDMVIGLLDMYMSQVSNKMNEVMKVLTIIATIFIPLTFIAGIYGMNFEYMPELKLPWAYPTLLILMLMTGVGMFYFFRRKKWL